MSSRKEPTPVPPNAVKPDPPPAPPSKGIEPDDEELAGVAHRVREALSPAARSIVDMLDDVRQEVTKLGLVLTSEQRSHAANCELLTEERDLERSRFAAWAVQFGELATGIEGSPDRWGGMRNLIASTLENASKEFARYAAGQTPTKAKEIENQRDAAIAERDKLARQVDELHGRLREVEASWEREHAARSAAEAHAREASTEEQEQRKRAEQAEAELDLRCACKFAHAQSPTFVAQCMVHADWQRLARQEVTVTVGPTDYLCECGKVNHIEPIVMKLKRPTE